MSRWIVVVVVGLVVSSAQGKTIHVRVGGTGDGSSWGSAYGSLQAALDDTEPNDDIWVADGMYKPTSDYGTGLGDRGKHFRMKGNVSIYGGFSSTGDPSWDDRDWGKYEAVLSGDLLGNDGPDFAGNGENSYHVFYHPSGTNLDATAILDGFTITGGNAYVLGITRRGGGMYNEGNSSPTVANCIFRGNSANAGGGMNNYESAPIVTGCIFSGNWANFGGGMENYYSSPTVADCTFTGNSAGSSGGGMENWIDSSPTVANCTFNGNSATDGGGMYNFNNSSPTVTDCTFSDNSAGSGGGGMNNYKSDPTVTGCTFSGNLAGDGGGMENFKNSSATVANCTFNGNSADVFGGGMRNYESDPIVTDCTFSGNSAGSGGGIHNFDNMLTVTGCIFTGNEGTGLNNFRNSSVLTNCTISNNSGQGIRIEESHADLVNCIVWGNSPQIEFVGGWGTALVSYSDIQGGWVGTENISSDPQFVDADGLDDIAGTEDDNLRLSASSSCIDAGDNSAATLLTDIDGHPRIIDGDCDDTAVADIGVHEFNFAYMGDVDYSCGVDFSDVSVLLGTWLVEDRLPAEDLNRDGTVDFDDFGVLALNFGLMWEYLPRASYDPLPADGAIDVFLNTALTWAAGANAASYDVYFGTASPGTYQGSQTETTFDPDQLQLNTSYYWRIDAKNAYGDIIQGSAWRFTTSDGLPGVSHSPSPAHAAQDVSSTTDLMWGVAANATSYDVYFGTASPGTFQDNQTATTFNPGQLQINTTYYWRIDTKNAYEATQGTVWQFTTDDGLPRVSHSPSPAHAAQDVSSTTDLMWGVAANATSYDVYFGTVFTFRFQHNQTETTFDPGSLESSTTYAWRIDTINADGVKQQGPVWRFTTSGG